MSVNCEKVWSEHAQVDHEWRVAAERLRKALSQATHSFAEQAKNSFWRCCGNLDHLMCEVFIQAEGLELQRDFTDFVPDKQVLALLLCLEHG